MKKLNPAGLVLVLLFTIIEAVGLIYWLVFGNSNLGITILFITLLVEHFTSATQGALFPLFEEEK